MFVKKDLRKIPQILEDPDDERKEIKLFRRGPEFVKGPGCLFKPEVRGWPTRVREKLATCLHPAAGGRRSAGGLWPAACSLTSLSAIVYLLLQYVQAFKNLEYLSLYGNSLRSVDGIGVIKDSPLQRLNLGDNLLHELPEEFGEVRTCGRSLMPAALQYFCSPLATNTRCLLRFSLFSLSSSRSHARSSSSSSTFGSMTTISRNSPALSWDLVRLSVCPSVRPSVCSVPARLHHGCFHSPRVVLRLAPYCFVSDH